MQRMSLVSALLVLGMTGAACAESPNVATSGPYNPNAPSQAPELQAQIRCSPDTTLPNTVDTQPKSGRLAGAAPMVPNAGSESMRFAGRVCPDNQRAPVQPGNALPRR
ncbi:MAG: hypothetical protein ACREFL_10470 [Stellaceae bacterium]